MILEYQTALEPRSVNRHAIVPKGSLVVEPSEHVQQGRLSAARAANDGDEIARVFASTVSSSTSSDPRRSERIW